jgi:hypothetical protein
MNTNTPLIKVNTLSKKLAQQITMLPDGHASLTEQLLSQRDPKSKQNRIYDGLAKRHTGPLGWLMGAALGLSGVRASIKFWLVRMDDQLYFVKALEETSDTGRYFAYTPQLFIS